MSLFRLYWIPEGADANDGVYVRYPHRDLMTIVALESLRHGAIVIGEDLGTVEPVVRSEMRRRSMLGVRIMWFGAPSRFPRSSVAAASTHDLPTIPGVWTGADARERDALGLNGSAVGRLRETLRRRVGLAGSESPAEVVVEAYRALARCSSSIALANLDDAALATLRPNQPGTTSERPNWSIPLPLGVEDLESSDTAARVAAALAAERPEKASRYSPDDGSRGDPARASATARPSG